MKNTIMAILALYRSIKRTGLFTPSCRFVPTCSAYASEAVDRHGAGRGSLLTVKRLFRCHPWHAGGFDQVP